MGGNRFPFYSLSGWDLTKPKGAGRSEERRQFQSKQEPSPAYPYDLGVPYLDMRKMAEKGLKGKGHGSLLMQPGIAIFFAVGMAMFPDHCLKGTPPGAHVRVLNARSPFQSVRGSIA